MRLHTQKLIKDIFSIEKLIMKGSLAKKYFNRETTKLKDAVRTHL